MKRTLLPAVPAVLVLLAGPASAHATFSSPASGSVAAGATTSLVLDVPNEREDTNHNTRVDVVVPGGWTAVSCQAQATWTCDAKATVSGQPAVTWLKSSAAGAAQDEVFRFTARAATGTGSYPFKTLQTYDTGEVVRWIGPSGSDEPAPYLSVTPATATATPTAVRTSSPTRAAATPPPPRATASPSESAASPTAQPSTTAAAAAGPPSAGASVTAPPSSPPTEAPTDTATAPSRTAEPGAEESSSALPWLALGALAALVAAGVVVRRVRSS